MKYGAPEQAGWGPRMRLRFGYFNPDDHYEAMVDRLVTPGSSWLDVGCGRKLIPSNVPLGEELSKRCGLLVGVGPDCCVARPKPNLGARSLSKKPWQQHRSAFRSRASPRVSWNGTP